MKYPGAVRAPVNILLSLKNMFLYAVNRSSYMSAHVLLNLLNKFEKKIRCEALLSILSVFPNKFNQFNNTGARMLKSHFICKFYAKHHDFAIRKCEIFMDINA